MEYLLGILIAVQGIFILIDELVYHRRRRLKAFERWGHIVDSLLFAAPLGVAALFPPGPIAINVYIGLAVVSSLVVTKDEWVHAAECDPAEQWVHSVLFILHSAVLIGVGIFWGSHRESWLLSVLPVLVLLLGVYQMIYWNVWDAYLRRTNQT